MIFKKPKFWDYKKLNYLSYLLKPLTLIILARNLFLKLQSSKKYPIKTICIGNIYVGGTGKTPLCIKLNEILKYLNFKTVFIKKYYKNQLDERKLLSLQNELISKKCRKDAIEIAIKEKRNLAIFDDGLQDNSINYDISFVCFNTETFIGNGQLIPAGPLREKLSSLNKYKAVFLNGNGEKLENIESEIKQYNSLIKIFYANYQPCNLEEFDKNKNYLIFSGIGNPNSFEKTLLNYDFKICKSLCYPDHYQYSIKDIKKIKELAKKLNAEILTTEKDYTRLDLNQRENINYIKVKLSIKNEADLIKFLKENL
jgi:tetraacyldisaccharide 4'-kinase